MKCIPMKPSGRCVPAASLVMEIEEVLDASMLSERSPASASSAKTAFLTAKSSLTASITKSKPATALMAFLSPSSPYCMRSLSSGTSASLSLPFLFSLAAQSATNCLLLSRLPGNLSRASTSTPACLAATMAMPVPIWPHPTTPRRFTLSVAGAPPHCLLRVSRASTLAGAMGPMGSSAHSRPVPHRRPRAAIFGALARRQPFP
mmetsp:Transcript_100980/g.263294  ORF Transcript_100980/g.263294 Transcript_100980/m.263294 type:complete len:204 (+) Transcript_100980:598-1209(+)